MSRLKHELMLLLSNSIHSIVPVEDVYDSLDSDSKHGDISYPCFAVARRMCKSPKDFYTDKISFLNYGRDLPFIKSVDYKDGFANFTLDRSKYIQETLRETDNRLSKRYDKKGTILLEYPSPNLNKELHVGHLRNLVIGHALRNVFTFLGYRAEWTLYQNDLGIGMCQAYIGTQEFEEELEDVSVYKRAGTAYTLFHQHAENRPELYDKAEKLLEEMLEEDEYGYRPTPDGFTSMSVYSEDSHEHVYSWFVPRCGYNNSWSERITEPMGRKLILQKYEEGVFEKDDKGNIIANLEQYDLPNKVLLRANGTSVYATGDVGLADLVKEWKHPDNYIYITGNEQDLYFRQLFKILEMLGFDYPKEHVSHGMVNLPDGKMKSRSGTVVAAQDVMDNLYSRSGSIELAVGTIVYGLLKFNRKRDIQFDPEEAFKLEGDTGIRIQYAYARMRSLLENQSIMNHSDIDFDELDHDLELRISIVLDEFSDVIDSVVERL